MFENESSALLTLAVLISVFAVVWTIGLLLYLLWSLRRDRDHALQEVADAFSMQLARIGMLRALKEEATQAKARSARKPRRAPIAATTTASVGK